MSRAFDDDHGPRLPPVTRRAALAALSMGAATLLAGCASPRATARPVASILPPSITSAPVTSTPIRTPTPTPTPTPSTPAIARVAAPTSPFTGLPRDGHLLAWTVDDGADPTVVRDYAAFAERTGTRLTLFATGNYPAWRKNADVLRPLVKSGQVQMGNHTWSHPDLTSLSDQDIVDELQRTHDLIGELFSVDARPFFRPPYGYYNDRMLHAAASIGYTAPTMWYGSLADSSPLPEAEIVRLANEWFLPQHIVIGHLNHPPVTHVFDQLHQVIVSRGLQTVTMNDVFTSPQHP